MKNAFVKSLTLSSIALFWGLNAPAFAGGNLEVPDPQNPGQAIQTRWDERLMPMEWVLSSFGYPGSSLTNDDIIAEITPAFDVWENVATGYVSFTFGGEVDRRNTGIDGNNLVTFTDSEVEFPSGVAGFGYSYSFAVETLIDDTNNDIDGDGNPDIPNGVYPAGAIYDGDIVLNSSLTYATSGENGTLDLRSILLHEVGHVLGMSHSMIEEAVMYPFLKSDLTQTRALATDDEATLSWLYSQEPAYSNIYGEITGTITNGSTGLPILGAHVFALDIATAEKLVGAYSGLDGSYVIPIEPGNYYVGIEPLDGDPIAFDPARVNDVIALTGDTFFVEELFDANESNIEADPLAALPVAVVAGNVTNDIHFQTNVGSVPGVTRVFVSGMNYFAFPVEVPTGATAYDLLPVLGDESEINAIDRLNPETQLFERVSYLDGVPVGANFPVVRGEGYIVHAQQQTSVSIQGTTDCPTVSLISGLNIIGVPCPPSGYSAYELLEHLGGENEIVSLKRYNPETLSYDVTEYSGGEPSGDDFFIVNGESYLVESRVNRTGVHVPGIGSIYPPSITAISPGVGIAGDLVLIEGEGFSENVTENQVLFNSVGAHVLYSSINTIAVIVPANAASGDLSVLVDGQSSNTVEFIVAPNVVVEGAEEGNALLSGQTANGQLNAAAEQDRYTFTALAGSRVTINAETVSGNADLMVVLEGPSGVALISDDDSGPGSSPAIRGFELPSTGIYSVVVTAISGVGDYALTVDVLNTTTQSQVSVLQGDSQSTLVGDILPKPLEVYVTSSTGEPLVGVPVTFTATNLDLVESTQGFSMVNAGTTVITTNQGGFAVIEATAPDTVGVFDITVTVPGMDPVVMQVSTIATPVEQMIVSSQVANCGDGCEVGQPVDAPYSILYLDGSGQPVENVFTEWHVVAGDGSLDNFVPSASGSRQLTGASGTVEVTHTLGQKLYFEVDGELTLNRIPQAVVAVVPIQVEPVLFTAVPKAGPPASIESLRTNYVLVTRQTSALNAINIQIRDQFGNPAQGVEVTGESDDLIVLPGLLDGELGESYLTNPYGLWVGQISTENNPEPTINEFYESIGSPYRVTVSEPSAGSVSFDVDVDLGPTVVADSGRGQIGFIGRSLEYPIIMRAVRFQRYDQNSNGSWLDEGFENLYSHGIENVQMELSIERNDGVEPDDYDAVATTVNGQRELILSTDTGGRIEADIELGDMGGLLALKAEVLVPIEVQLEDQGEPVGGPIAFPLESYQLNAADFVAMPIEMLITIDAGVDWASLDIRLNDGTVIFDGSNPNLPLPGDAPGEPKLVIDGVVQNEWPSVDVLTSVGSSSRIEIIYSPLASELNEGDNSLTISAEVTEFDGTVTSLSETQTFAFNDNLDNNVWEATLFHGSTSYSNFSLGRIVSLAQRQGQASSVGGVGIGSFNVFNVPLSQPASVEVEILDANQFADETLIGATSLPAGDHRFVLLREDIGNNIVPLQGQPDLYIRVTTTPDSTGTPHQKLYAGELTDSSTGTMLGQIIQHDVKIQDGSLTLRREDLALQGAGPQLTFIRNYSNTRLPENSDTALGKGWSHNHDIFAKVLAWSDGSPQYGEKLPGWIANTRSGFSPTFLTADALLALIQSASPQIPSMITVSNGGTFELDVASGDWVGQRGNHGTLTGTLTSGYVYTSKDGTEYAFRVTADSEYRYQVATVTDRNGNSLAYNYDSYNDVSRVTDQAGRYLAFTYDYVDNGRRRLVSVNAQVNGETPAENIYIGFNYFRAPGSGAPAEETASHFDEIGMLQRFTRADFIERYDYEAQDGDNEPNLVLAEDAVGNSTQYQYLTPSELPGNFLLIAPGTRRTDVVSRVCYPTADLNCDDEYAEFTYDTASENARIVRDLRGYDTRYILNPWGNPSRIEEPGDKVTEFDWSIDLGEPDNVMRAKRDLSIGANWEYEYDALGNLIREVDPYDQEMTQTWDQTFSVLTSRVDKNGHSLTQVLDGNGNVEQEIRDAYLNGVKNPVDVTVVHSYGSQHGIHGLRLGTTDARSNETTFDYDGNGNLRQITEPAVGESGVSISTFEYDARGLRIAEEDANENRTVYEYDGLDRLTLVTDAEGNTVETQYDAKGNKRVETTIDRYTIGTETHARTLILAYEYDERDRVVEITRTGGLDDDYQIGGQKTFVYDSNSNVESETDWKGVATTHQYDGLNRRTTTTNRMGDSMLTAYAWVVDEGLQKTVTDYEENDTVEQHDLLGRLVNVQHPTVNHSDGSSNAYQRVIGYDAYDNITSILDEESKLTRYEYDPRYLKIEQINALSDSFVWEYDENGNLTGTVDEEGNATTFDYDPQNRLIEKQEPENHSWEYTYYPNDTLATEIDPWDFEYAYTYNQINQRTSVRDPDGLSLVSHTKDGELVYRRDAEGRETRSLYGPAGRLQVATDARGRTTTYRYDHNNNVTDKTLAWSGIATGPSSSQQHYQFDALDRMTHRHDGYETSIERVTNYGYDRQSNKTRETNPEGRITSYLYDELYRLKTIVTPATADNLATDTHQKFDGVGNLVWVRDRRSHETRTEYDDLHRPFSVTDALLQTVVTEYDNVGNPTRVTNKRGHTTETVYDDLYRVSEQHIDGGGTRFRLVYNEYDLGSSGVRRDAVTDANGNRVVTDKDFRGNPLNTTLPAGASYGAANIVYAYDTTGLLTSTTDAAGFTTARSYFDDGMLASITNAEGHTTQYECDLFGNQVIVTKPLQNTQTSTYDARNRLVSVLDHQGNLTRFEYDVNSNLRHQYMPAAAATGENHVEYTYDTLNRKRSHVQYKSGGDLSTSYVYDAEGNLTQTSDANGQIFIYSYDELNRLDTETFPAGDDINTIVHTYDANNNMDTVTETKPSGVEISDYDYDLLDRLVLHTQRGHTINYAYDNNGNRTSVTAPGGATTYTFDSRNRLETATASGAPAATTYIYLQNGWTDVVTHANGTSVDYDYYQDGQVQTITNRSGANVVSSFAYLYDENNNRSQQIETQTGFATAQVLTTDYGYDTLDRLENYTETAGDATHNATHTFTYFPSYDRQTEIVSINGTETKNRSFAYDETYWLDTITETAGSGGIITYVYDNNGNTLSKTDGTGVGPASTLFAYNRRNQLKTVDTGVLGSEENQGTYDYNYDGMRIRHLGSDRGDIEYVYDQKSIIDEVENNTTTQVAHYRYGDRLLSLNNGTEEQFYHYATLGTTTNLSDASGQIQVSYRTDPFGEITQQEGTSVNRQVFTGHEHDEETGLIYMKARFYDPDVGRFLNQDTYLGESGTPPSLHRYLYAYSNPNYYTDPSGHCVEPITGAACLTVAAYTAVAATAAAATVWWNTDSDADGRTHGEESIATIVDAAGNVADKIGTFFTVEDELLEGNNNTGGNQIPGAGPTSTAGDQIASSGPISTAGDQIASSGPTSTAGDQIAPSGPTSTYGDQIYETDIRDLILAKEGGSSYDERLKQTPVNNGDWTGIRGESTFHHNDEKIKRITKGAGIEYDDAYPDFGPVSAGTVEIGNMGTSRPKNFRQADEALAKQWDKSPREIKKWRKENEHTWHEVEDLKTMELVPTIINAKHGHMGGVGEIERGKQKENN